MKKVQNMIKKIVNIPKERYITVMVLLILAISVSIPTLARYKNRLDLAAILNSYEVWDGTVATDYANGNGSEENPYIISNAKELAFFAKQLKDTNYENTYFKISKDIIINKGTFNYRNNDITYVIDDKTMYIQNYTNKLFETKEKDDDHISTVNEFDSLDNFAGYLDGDHHRIYGLYMTSNEEELGLFNNLSGTVENLYIENAMIYGGSTTAIFASTTNNATLKNIYTTGNVVGTLIKNENEETYTIEDYSNEKIEEVFNDKITLPNINTENIKSIRLKGTYTSNEEQALKINDIELYPGEFDLELDSSVKELSLEIESEILSTIELKNLKYEVVYGTGITSGIIANANKTQLTNIINKANVYGKNSASGLLGIITDTNIKNAYNTGFIYANNATALIDTIKDSTTQIKIDRLYNNGLIGGTKTYSFVKEIINNEKVEINDTFNVSMTNSTLKSVKNLKLNNVLDINENTIKDIELITKQDLENTAYLKNTLNYKEFIDNTVLEINEDAVWVYENKNLPILYIDDLNDPIAVLTVGTYNWDSIGYELEEIYLSSNTAFMITPKDKDEEIKAYYYIHKDKNALTKTQLENVNWLEYTDIVTLNEEGYYVVYAKVIDEDDNIKYISSEQLTLDLEGPNATIKMEDNTWNTSTEDLSSVYISEETDITVTAKDTYSDVAEIKYYVSNIKLTANELKEIESNKWVDYEDKITLTKKGTYIIYIRVTDTLKHKAYYNTDYIIFGGFEETLTLNDDQTTKYDKVSITDNSEVTYNFNSNIETIYIDGYTANLITSINMPLNTKIILKNNNTHKVYKYVVKEEKKEYKLNEFIQIGQTNNEITFVDEDFINEEDKNISITFDFSASKITENVEFNAYLEIHDKLEKTILSTLKSTIKNTKIYAGDKTSITISTESEITPIELNNDTTTDIEITTDMLIDIDANEEIYNTEYNNKKLGIAIKLVDSNGQIVDKNHLKNVSFKIGEKSYSPDNDGIVRIKLSNIVAKTHSTLRIITYATNSKLETGDYNFIITPYISADGKYSNNYEDSNIIIKATTIKTEEEVDYGFNVIMDSEDKIIYKENNKTKMNFEIIESGELESPNIRISLYKRQDLSPYNQTYEIVDLKDYIIDELIEVEENAYRAVEKDLELTLNTTKFLKTGYEFRFELYDGDKHITTIKKKFIVR